MIKHSKNNYLTKFIILVFLIVIIGTTIGLIFGLLNINVLDYQALQVTNHIVVAVAMTLSTVVLLVEIGGIFFNHSASIITLFIAAVILILQFFHLDFTLSFSILLNYTLSPTYLFISKIILQFLAHLIFILVIIHLANNQIITLSKKIIIILILLLILTPFLSFFTFGFITTFIVNVILIGFIMYIIYKTDKLDYISTLELTIVFAVSYLAFTNQFAYITDFYIPFLVPSTITIIIAFCFMHVYIDFAMNKIQEADEKKEIEKRLEVLQVTALKNQSKPHFLFNSLQLIKSIYMTDPQKGNEAIDTVSRIIRGRVDSVNSYLVSFEKEMEIVHDYIALINISSNKPVSIIYNIDCYDFEVPYFGVQTFIENACKYSNIQNKDDGFIQISSYEDDESYCIEIEDNGIGFDEKDIKTDSTGILNSTERYKLLLGASIKIKTAPNEGCKITIKIPKVKKA